MPRWFKVLVVAVPLMAPVIYVIMRPAFVVIRDNRLIVESPQILWGSAIGGLVVAVALVVWLTRNDRD